MGIRYNPVIRDFYQRLCAVGAQESGITACTQVILNSMMKHHRNWSPITQIS